MTIRVLIVDDEPDVESLFRQQFRREVRQGLFAIDFVLSAKAALEVLTADTGQEIALLISDISMPVTSGLVLLDTVRSRWPKLPVFMISDYGDDDTGASTIARGATKFMTKPLDFPSLKQEVTAVITKAG
jgi:DNA-binding NtrC family response regulator